MPRDFLGKFNVSSDLQYTPGIMMLEDCEGTCNWEMAHTGDDSVVEFTTENSLFGTQCLQVVTRDTNAAGDDYCKATRWLAYPESKLLVFRGRVMLPNPTIVKTAEMYIGWYGPSVFGLAGLEWDRAACTLSVWTTGGSWTNIAIMGLGIGHVQWNDFEIVIDLVTNKYISVMFNGVRNVPTVLPVTGANAQDYRNTHVVCKSVAVGAMATPVFFDSMYVGSYLDV